MEAGPVHGNHTLRENEQGINDLQEIELTLNKHWNVRLECEMTGMC